MSYVHSGKHAVPHDLAVAQLAVEIVVGLDDAGLLLDVLVTAPLLPGGRTSLGGRAAAAITVGQLVVRVPNVA